MNATPVAYTHVECDSCGAMRAAPVKGATAARIAAAADGWKFAEWDVKGLNKYGPRRSAHSYGPAAKIVPRQWDACPACPLPAGPEEAYEIRKKREAGAS